MNQIEEPTEEVQENTVDIDAGVEVAEGSDEVSEEPKASASSEESSAEKPSAEEEKDEGEGERKIVASTNPLHKWYVVHVYSGFEEKAKSSLLHRVKQSVIQDGFGQVFIPKTISERVLKSGKKKRVEKTSYPGYMLVEMEMNDDTKSLVRGTPRVTGFVGNQMDPRPVSDAEVLRLTSPEAAREMERSEKSSVQYTKGEKVKVTDGAFANFEGIIDEVKPEKSKVLVLVSIFGRETPVELDFTQVKKLK